MSHGPSRRQFLTTAARGAALAGLADLGVFRPLSPASAEEAKVTPEMIRFTPDIEPVVRLIEETPREKCVAVLVEELRRGLPYRRFLSAIFLACLRKSNTHHETYMVHAAHQLSLDARPEEQLLPLFGAVDGFKRQQQRFPAPPVAPINGPLPSADKASAEFQDAMDKNDRERAERSLVALVRGEAPQQTMARFWILAARDRSLAGHRAIGVANCHAVLQTIGYQHAEPTLRFMLRHLFERHGRQELSFAANLEKAQKSVGKLPPNWTAGGADEGATLELYAVIRAGKAWEANELAYKQLESGKVSAGPVWDAIHLAAAELMIRERNGTEVLYTPLHSNTSASALHYAFRASTDPMVRLVILLQAVNWIADFTASDDQQKRLRDMKITELAEGAAPEKPEAAVEEIFLLLPPRTFPATPVDRAPQDEAARKAFVLLSDPANAPLFMQTARSFLFQKATGDAHDYKLPAAIFEDQPWVSPRFRPHILAASVHWLHGSRGANMPALEQAREALKKG